MYDVHDNQIVDITIITILHHPDFKSSLSTTSNWPVKGASFSQPPRTWVKTWTHVRWKLENTKLEIDKKNTGQQKKIKHLLGTSLLRWGFLFVGRD